MLTASIIESVGQVWAAFGELECALLSLGMGNKSGLQVFHSGLGRLR